MRTLVFCLCIAGTVHAKTPWGIHLDARKALVTHPAGHAQGGARHKPDDVGVYDLQRVDIQFTVPPDGLPTDLTFDVTLESRIELSDTLPLLLVHSEALEITTESGVELPFEHLAETGELLVQMQRPIPPDTTVRLLITARLNYVCAGGPSCSEEGTYAHLAEAGWYPMSLEYPASDRFNVRLDITSTGDRFPSSIGALDVEDGEGETRRWRYRTETPISALAIALVPDAPAGAPNELIQFFGPRPAPGMEVFLTDLIESFSNLFGPYPYSRLALTAIPNSARSAIGPQANLLIPLSLWMAPGSPEERTFQREVISHEFGHQYFFNSVGVTDPAEAWLSEGFAEYASVLYSARTTGSDDHQSRNYWGYLTGVAPGADAPVQGLEVRQGPHFFEIVYLKASTVLWMLRNRLESDVFDAILQEYVAEFTGQISTTPEFITFFESRTDTDLGAFFDRWIFRGGHPRLRAQTRRAGVSRAEVNFVLADETDPPFTGTLPIRVHSVDGERWLEAEIGQSQRIRLGESGWIEVDPERTWLRRIRPDPAGDVNLDGVVDGMDLLDVHAARGRALPGPDWRDAVDVVRDGSIDENDLRAVVDGYGSP